MAANDKNPLRKDSDAWVSHIKPYLRARIEELRDELERPGAETEHLRGAIAELRGIIQWVEPDLIPTGELSPS